MQKYVIVRCSIEGIHRWEGCDLDEVSYLRDYHRHCFQIKAMVSISHSDREVEFIQLAHKIRGYLIDKYFDTYYQCCLFDGRSCEMLAEELLTQFDLYEVEFNEDNEGGALIRRT